MRAETDIAFSSPRTWIVAVGSDFWPLNTDLCRDITTDVEIVTRSKM